MSHRALRRLRGDDHLTVLGACDEGSSLDGSVEEESVTDDQTTPRKNMFCFSDDSSSSEEEDESAASNEELVVLSYESKETEKVVGKNQRRHEDKKGNDKENIDDILAEYAAEYNASNLSKVDIDASSGVNFILSGVDPKLLDLDYNLRLILGNDAHAREPEEQQGGRQRGRRGATRQRPRQGNSTIGKKLYFGKARENWSRPPSYVGGGMGMEIVSNNVSIPHPYMDSVDYNKVQWHQFIQSDTYAAMEGEFERIANLGDVNMLAMFVAENPYCASALLQFAMVLAHTGSMEQGTELLRRSIFVYEYASIPSLFGSLSLQHSNGVNSHVLMDSDLEENRSFFSALFRLMQISCMVGCLETALSVSIFLFSLDPLRDPMGVLLTLDYFALATVNSSNTQYLVDLVESQKIQIFYKDYEPVNLIDLPNVAFNYALALHRLAISTECGDDNFDDNLSIKANDALFNALSLYPDVLLLLLEKNGVDTRGRSFQTDWPSVIPYFSTLTLDNDNAVASKRVIFHLIKIFVQRSHKLWSSDEVVKWLYDVSLKVMSGNGSEPFGEKDLAALNRYTRCDPSDYEDRFKTLPAEANPLDPALVAPALAVDPNHRRIRRNRALNNAMAGANDMEVQQMFLQELGQNGALIDPDSPLLEVFLHSLMPWAHVDGVNHRQPPT